eukprot:gene11605-12800_t
MSAKFTDDLGASEGAVDLGGPRRELLTLLLQHLQNSSIFVGEDTSKSHTSHAHHIPENDYFLAGRVIAMCLVHGAAAPKFFSPVLYEALFKENRNIHVCVDTVPDKDVKECMEKKYTLKLNQSFSEEVERQATYNDIHALCRNKFDVPQNTATYLAHYNGVKIEESFTTVEDFAYRQRDKKKSTAVDLDIIAENDETAQLGDDEVDRFFKGDESASMSVPLAEGNAAAFLQDAAARFQVEPKTDQLNH